VFLVRSYYQLKPFLPRGMRLALRRWRARRRQRSFATEWPIRASAARKPLGWRGWPEGKQFALVLTHDVEGTSGLARCRSLADLEMQCGFSSAFNFIPEGDYEVPSELREWMVQNGFEIGVHDLKHDGKLYWSREAFRRQAASINRYLKEWNAVGFRSGFMLRHLEWLHDLEVLYDSSTFDTDPFEPQPEGVDTIFPFWVPARPSTINYKPSTVSKGYIELPYTLPQDFTLFLILQERTIEIWKRKLDWLAENGGMAMLDVHPDYLDVAGAGRHGISYPIRFYRELLDYIRDRYEGQFWHALPRDVARYAREQLMIASPA
jgi:hypothetical protein